MYILCFILWFFHISILQVAVDFHVSVGEIRVKGKMILDLI